MKRNIFKIFTLVLLFIFCAGWHEMFGNESYAFSPDIYEDDDTFSLANVIVINGEPQKHNFHDQDDQDWVKFYGIEGQVYSIKVNNAENNCNAVLELYDTDGTTQLKRVNDWGPGGKEFLPWVCPKDGAYFIKVSNYDPLVFGEGTEYELQVYLPEAPFLGLITGKTKDKITGKPIKDTTIRTLEYPGTAISDKSGEYEMWVEADSYTVTASAEGYEPYSQRVSVEEAGISTLNIELIPFSNNTTTTVRETTTSSSSTTTTSICPAKKMFGAQSSEVNLMYVFRDKILSETPEGNQYIAMYYEHTAEVASVLDAQPALEKKTRELFLQLMPALGNVLAQKPVTLSTAMIRQSISLIDALSAKASPALNADLQGLRNDIQSRTIFRKSKFNIEK